MGQSDGCYRGHVDRHVMKQSIGLSLNICLDRSSSEALYRQIAEAVRVDVVGGRLTPGMKLPSTRVVADTIGVHRRTVVQAFRLLETEGWVVSGVGQGTFVAHHSAQLRSGPDPEDGLPLPTGVRQDRFSAHPDGRGGTQGVRGPFSWDAVLRRRPLTMPEAWRYWTQGRDAAGMIRFTGATADPSFFPTEDFRAIVDEVFKTHGSSALDYGPTEGYMPLREWVSDRLESRGVFVEPDQVMIITGSQQGLDLISRLLVGEGDTAAVEEPGYTNGFRLFQVSGARALGVPVDDGGLRCDILEQACAAASPRLLYLMPIFQNPTGLCLEENRIPALLDICARYHVPIVEDQFDADLFYEGSQPKPVKAQDGAGRVVLLGSFSKILFPGLRLGWVVLPPALIAPLRELKQMADFSSGLLAQFAMNLYCRRGLLDLHLARVREVYGARLRAMLSALETHFPARVQWTRPRGGLTLWVTMPEGVDSLDLLQQARREGVDFSPGSLFYPNGGGTRNLRLSYIRETEERIARGVETLGSLLKTNLARAEQAPAAGPFF
jgi:2-aminoadipate transaminase